MLDLGDGRVADSLARMQAAATGPARHHPNITRMAPDLVEAAVRLGQLSQAAEAAGRFSRWASLVGQPWAVALHVRCQALIASDSEAERHYERALSLHEQDTRPTFTLFSLLGGFAQSGAELIAARAAQGIGGAILAPASLSLLD